MPSKIILQLIPGISVLPPMTALLVTLNNLLVMVFVVMAAGFVMVMMVFLFLRTVLMGVPSCGVVVMVWLGVVIMPTIRMLSVLMAMGMRRRA